MKQSLNALAHELANHARSDTSALEAQVAEAARGARTWSATLDLLSESPFLPDFPVSGALRRAAKRLGRHFAKQLESAGVSPHELQRARLQFVFAPGGLATQGRVRCEIVTQDGREYGHTMEPDAGGRPPGATGRSGGGEPPPDASP